MTPNESRHYRAASARVIPDDNANKEMAVGFGVGLAIVWIVCAAVPLYMGYVFETMVSTSVAGLVLSAMTLAAGLERRSWGDAQSIHYGGGLIDLAVALTMVSAIFLSLAVVV